MLFWLSDVFSRSRDPIVTRHRALQRHGLLSIAATLLCFLTAVFVSTVEPVDSPNHQIIHAVTDPIAWAFLALAFLSFLWSIWAIFALWRFEHDHG